MHRVGDSGSSRAPIACDCNGSKKASPPPETLDAWCRKAVKYFPASMRSSSGDFPFETALRIFTNRCSQMGFLSHVGTLGFCPVCCRCCRRRRSIGSEPAGRFGILSPICSPNSSFTGHEICRGGQVGVARPTRRVFSSDHREPRRLSGLLPHRPGGQRAAKLALPAPVRLLSPDPEPNRYDHREFAAAHSPRVAPQELATRTGRS